MRGGRQGRFHVSAGERGGLKKVGMDVQVARRVHLRCTRLEGSHGIGDRRVHVVIDLHFLGRLAGMKLGVGHH